MQLNVPKRKLLISRRAALIGLGATIITPSRRPLARPIRGFHGFPGQLGNPVGYAATPANVTIGGLTYSNPAYPGSLTTWPGGNPDNGVNATSGAGTPSNPWVYEFYNFDGGTGGTAMTSANTTFIGCAFQSNQQQFYNVLPSGSNVNYSYCTTSQRTALLGRPPYYTDWGQWPSGGLGRNTIDQIPGVNCFTYSPDTGNAPTGYEYGFAMASNAGVTNWDHCDIWGFGNAIVFADSATAPMSITDCWIHDASPGNGYHTDGPGYLNGGPTSGTPPHNITIHHCTIASLGNTNAIAMQAAGNPYSNMTFTNNYFSGFGLTCDFGHNATGNNNWTVTDNVFATDIQWVFGPLYADFSAMFTLSNGLNNLWRRNVLKVYPGSVPSTENGPPGFNFTAANNGNYLLPNSTLSTTDWAN